MLQSTMHQTDTILIREKYIVTVNRGQTLTQTYERSFAQSGLARSS